MGLWLAAIETERIESDLVWEPSRGGQLFPHLYGTLRLDHVLWCKPLPLGPDGHVFPEGMA